MRIRGDRLSWIAVLIGAAAVVAWWLMPPAVLVETAPVTTGRFTATVDEDGKTRIRERYIVAAPLAGQSTRVHLKTGDAVKAGDVIGSIQPAPPAFLDPRSRREAEERLGAAEAARERTRATLERAQAQAAQAQTDLERTRQLAQRGVATAQALERDELSARVADRELRAAEFLDHASEHDLGQAKAVLARYGRGENASDESWIVTAPVSGVILKVIQESETVVAAGAPLMEIGDPHDLEVVVDVLSTYVVEIKPGAAVRIEHWGGPDVLAGRVRRVEPEAFTKISTLGVEEQRVNVIVDLVSPPESVAGLGDGYRVDARITVFSRDDAIVVPAGAVFRSGDTSSVYVVKNGRAEMRPVAVVRRAERSVAVASGVAPGDVVIIYPSDKIRPGVRIAAQQR